MKTITLSGFTVGPARARAGWVAGCLLAAFLLAACGSEINRNNFDRIKNDMSKDEVFHILGEPDKLNTIELGRLSGSTAQWSNNKQLITVTFAGNKVAFKTYGKRHRDDE